MSGDAIPDPEPTPSDAPPIPAAAPAECRNHSERAAVALCARCADFVCGLCSIPLDAAPDGSISPVRNVFCPTCAVLVRADVLRLGAYVPWEDRKRLGWPRAAWRTIEAMFTRPAETFDRLPLSGGYSDPLLFAMLMRGLVVTAYGLGFAAFYLILAAATRDSMMVFQAVFQAVSIGFNIAYAAALLFAIAGMFHLGVAIFGGTRGFEATFRVFAYGRGVDVLDLIPIAGVFVRMGLQVYLYYLGLQKAQGLTKLQAISIAAAPILLVFLLSIVLVGMIVVIALTVAQT